MSEYISENRVLTNDEMTTNAIIIHAFLLEHGWSEQAIAGLLGNAQDESRINPGAWQGYKQNEKLGFGLLQWTPSNKVTEWLLLQGHKKGSLDGQLKRILFELEEGLQYYKTSNYPLTFKEFTTSTKEPEYLAMCFMNNYERPADRNQKERSTYAKNWYDYFNGGKLSKDVYEGIVTGNDVNIRTEANLNCAVIGQVDNGEKVEVLDVQGEWVKIRCNVDAYIHEKYIK